MSGGRFAKVLTNRRHIVRRMSFGEVAEEVCCIVLVGSSASSCPPDYLSQLLTQQPESELVPLSLSLSLSLGLSSLNSS